MPGSNRGVVRLPLWRSRTAARHRGGMRTTHPLGLLAASPCWRPSGAAARPARRGVLCCYAVGAGFASTLLFVLSAGVLGIACWRACRARVLAAATAIVLSHPLRAHPLLRGRTGLYSKPPGPLAAGAVGTGTSGGLPPWLPRGCRCQPAPRGGGRPGDATRRRLLAAPRRFTCWRRGRARHRRLAPRVPRGANAAHLHNGRRRFGPLLALRPQDGTPAAAAPRRAQRQCEGRAGSKRRRAACAPARARC